ncbi:ABC transporter permease [Desulfurivibrio dismutans]|uniref:ABC transporter permease n=1 Tax=Desulfurivibrio dismutans TaxID=1398908 RepID=UPI0023DAE151|nr:FtsX-like permease family protein [Desulfurivibrio alkaliphilus]MDF1615138.1 FtsX-like permease family protein [Desulfurivibrio alkaliphilus]
MKALHRKLWRELWQLRGQSLAIAVVIAGGLATLLMSLSSLESLRLSRDDFYRDYRFAEVFAELKRAPNELAPELSAIDGVRLAETRLQSNATLMVGDFADPISGRLISLPDGRQPELNRLFIRQGRLPAAGRPEVVISDAFADAHGLQPGDQLQAVLNGRLQSLVVSGIGVSPEHIYQLKPGELYPDNLRYGILWLNRAQLAAAFDLDGAFNSVVLALDRRARPPAVVAELDRLLAPYGGVGALLREDQQSHSYLEAEFAQLAVLARVFPAIFLSVAAFLLNVVLARLISTQREQIAILKAFGYRNWQVGWHYCQLVLLMTGLGLGLGSLAGLWLGEGLAVVYAEFFRFPRLDYHLSWQVLLLGAAVTGAAALLGTLSAVRRAVLLPPAEAMRPEIPAAYRPTVIERLGWQGLLSQPSRMILRNFERRPGKALLSVIGVALACAIMMMGNFWQDAADYMIDVEFGLAQRYDLAVNFNELAPQRVLHELQALPGVTAVEGQRAVPVRLRHGHRSFRTVLHGLEADGRLRRVLDTELAILSPPTHGLVLTDYLAEILVLEVGDTVRVESLEGRRRVLELPVTGLVQEHIGVAAYQEISAMNRHLGDGDVVGGALLQVSPAQWPEVNRRLRESPLVAGVGQRLAAITNFQETMAETVLAFSFITSLLAGSIAFGIVYNSARIALSERSRELASLRVLGLRQRETDYILLGELALLTALGIPLGWLLGRLFCWYMTLGLRSDLYRVPLVLETSTYALAALVVAVAALISGLIVRRLLHRIDLVAALKAAE